MSWPKVRWTSAERLSDVPAIFRFVRKHSCTCAGLLQKKSQDGLQTTMEATLMAQQTPAQREQVRQLQPGAVASWWQPGHPGWAIYPVDSEQFMSTGALENVNVTNEQIVAPLPMGCELPSPAFAADPEPVVLT